MGLNTPTLKKKVQQQTKKITQKKLPFLALQESPSHLREVICKQYILDYFKMRWISIIKIY